MAEKRKLVPIGTAAKKAGISRQSLQYYLMIGLMEPTEVTPTGRRLFDEKGIERIKLIKKLNDSGYPLRAIRELFIESRTDLTRLGARHGGPAPARAFAETRACRSRKGPGRSGKGSEQ